MKFKLKEEPKLRDERIVKYFAFLPVTIGKDMRWLEMVTIKQSYRIRWRGPGFVWFDVEFID